MLSCKVLMGPLLGLLSSNTVQACPHTGITTEELTPFLPSTAGTYDFSTIPEVKAWFSALTKGSCD
jgi:hypothetical protein